jgi:aconitase A
LLQTDFKNSDDHLFLLSARALGVWFSRPGQVVSHPVHMENFGVIANMGAELGATASHFQNLVHFGVLLLRLADDKDDEQLQTKDVLNIRGRERHGARARRFGRKPATLRSRSCTICLRASSTTSRKVVCCDRSRTDAMHPARSRWLGP